MRLQAAPDRASGTLALWQDQRQYSKADLDVDAHVKACSTCATGARQAGTPAHAYEFSVDTWRVVVPERFCPEGKNLMIEAARSGHLMLQGAI